MRYCVSKKTRENNPNPNQDSAEDGVMMPLTVMLSSINRDNISQPIAQDHARIIQENGGNEANEHIYENETHAHEQPNLHLGERPDYLTDEIVYGTLPQPAHEVHQQLHGIGPPITPYGAIYVPVRLFYEI